MEEINKLIQNVKEEPFLFYHKGELLRMLEELKHEIKSKQF